MDALGKLNQNPDLKHYVVGFILVPNENYGPRKELVENLTNGTTNKIENPLTTHNLNPNSYDPIINRCHQLGLTNS